jgi:hypothetical protein
MLAHEQDLDEIELNDSEDESLPNVVDHTRDIEKSDQQSRAEIASRRSGSTTF